MTEGREVTGDRFLPTPLPCATWRPGRCFFSDDPAPGMASRHPAWILAWHRELGAWSTSGVGVPLQDPPPASVRWAPHSPPSFLCLHL